MFCCCGSLALVGVTVWKAAVNSSDGLKTALGPVERILFLFVLSFLSLLPPPFPTAHAASTNLTQIPWRRWLHPAGQAGIRSPTRPSGRSHVGAAHSGPAAWCSRRAVLVAAGGCVSAGKETLVSPRRGSSRRERGSPAREPALILPLCVLLSCVVM